MCLSMDFFNLSCLGFSQPLKYRFMPLFKFGEISGIVSSNIFQLHSSFSLGILMK